MRYRWVVLLSFLQALVSGVSAQTSNVSDWYLAWTMNGQLVSFTPDGDVTPLIDRIFTPNFTAWRMDDGSVLAIITVAGNPGLYHVTEQLAAPITFTDGDSNPIHDTAWRIVGNRGDYVLVAPLVRVASGISYLVNLATNQAQILTKNLLTYSNNWPFSSNGSYVRYLSRESSESNTWTIREREIETGTERVISTVTDTFPSVSNDSYGENWIYLEHKDATNSYILISQSGTTQVLAQVEDETPFWEFFGDQITVYSPECQTNCSLEFRSSDENLSAKFVLPSPASSPSIYSQIDENHLLLSNTKDATSLWLADTENEPLLLGTWNPGYVTTPFNQLLSSDHRWLFALNNSDNKPGYQVWDLQKAQPILKSDPARQFAVAGVNYGTGGFIVNEDLKHFQYYRYRDERIFDLEGINGFYWQALADGTLLFAQVYGDNNQIAGIYRYDVDTKTYTLLVQDGIYPLIPKTP